MLNEAELVHWGKVIVGYRIAHAEQDQPLADFMEQAIFDIRAYRAALRSIADSAPSSPAGRAAWQEARRVLKGEKSDAKTSDAAK